MADKSANRWKHLLDGRVGQAVSRKIIIIVLVFVVAIIALVIQLERGINMYSGPVPFRVPELPSRLFR
jgi:hypothetical protein